MWPRVVVGRAEGPYQWWSPAGPYNDGCVCVLPVLSPLKVRATLVFLPLLQPCSGRRAGVEDTERMRLEDGTEVTAAELGGASVSLQQTDLYPREMGHLPIRDLIENNTVQFNTVVS